jgi:hypothetical protein
MSFMFIAEKPVPRPTKLGEEPGKQLEVSGQGDCGIGVLIGANRTGHHTHKPFDRIRRSCKLVADGLLPFLLLLGGFGLLALALSGDLFLPLTLLSASFRDMGAAKQLSAHSVAALGVSAHRSPAGSAHTNGESSASASWQLIAHRRLLLVAMPASYVAYAIHRHHLSQERRQRRRCPASLRDCHPLLAEEVVAAERR